MSRSPSRRGVNASAAQLSPGTVSLWENSPKPPSPLPRRPTRLTLRTPSGSSYSRRSTSNPAPSSTSCSRLLTVTLLCRLTESMATSCCASSSAFTDMDYSLNGAYLRWTFSVTSPMS